MFIVMFYAIGKSTQEAGVAVTTVAVKMSVIFPIAFSIWYDTNDTLTPVKITGILLALLSVYLTVYRKTDRTFDFKVVLLPVFLFIGMGIVDSFVKFAQSAYINGELAPAFSSVVFACSLVVGLVILPFNKPAIKSITKPKTWLLGALLGLANFGSMYFLLLALNHIDIATGQQAMGSVIFGINNIGIVMLSVIIGFLAYRERPKPINWIGIGLSIISIFLLAVS
jgi:drug/metabolite transporter (DMT)-like permease